jgi:hypothetical protein
VSKSTNIFLSVQFLFKSVSIFWVLVCLAFCFVTESVLSPSSGETSLLEEGRLRVDVVGQAGHVDVRGEDEGLGQVNEGKVVLEVERAKARVDGHVLGVAVLMRLGFDRLLGVPLASPDLDVSRIQMAGKWIIL